MTDNKLKIRIQIPQSSTPNNETHHSIPDSSEELKDIKKAPLDMQKISITLFVIFLLISSFIYLVFIDETEPALTVAKQSTTTNDSVASPSIKIQMDAPIENITDHLSEPMPIEIEASSNVPPLPTANEPLEAPIVIEEQNEMVPPETITEINKPIVEVIEPLVDASPNDQPQVIQAQLTSAIEQREPVDKIDHVELKQGNSERIHFFMRFRDLAEQQVSVRWYYQDKEITKINLNIGNNEQWRTHANKLLSKTRLGSWHVELRDASGILLAQRNFTVSNNP